MRKKASIVTKDAIQYSLWLVFDDRGDARMTRTRPGLGRSERAVELSVKLPMSLFRTPEMRVSLNVPDNAVEIPPIDIEAAANALRAVVGCDIDVRVAEHPKEQ